MKLYEFCGLLRDIATTIYIFDADDESYIGIYNETNDCDDLEVDSFEPVDGTSINVLVKDYDWGR